ncbi:unnamed protein product [Arabis nemorensis]|uniref:Uncharacterized protein n=1 Tax=Arabis nemorensis TaxID=586526 RepID=A0A565CMP7_9BRAS|nr:unnamed protein product [Arabis nemorensis]
MSAIRISSVSSKRRSSVVSSSTSSFTQDMERHLLEVGLSRLDLTDDATSSAPHGEMNNEVGGPSTVPQKREEASGQSDLDGSGDVDDSEDLCSVKDEVGSFAPLVNDEGADSPRQGLGRYIELEPKDSAASAATALSLEKMRRESGLSADIEFVVQATDQCPWAPPPRILIQYCLGG